MMLEAISPGRRPVTWNGAVPDVVRPLLEAHGANRDLTQALQSVVASLGFESFTYIYSNELRPTRDSRTFIWSTVPEAWLRIYDERGYLAIDPRLVQTVERVTPVIWTRDAFPPSPELHEFFDSAGKFGLRSGIAMSLRDPAFPRVLFSLNSSVPRFDDTRLKQVVDVLGDVMALGTFVHAIFMSSASSKASAVPLDGQRLSGRERECLQLVARGCTSAQIGEALGISERTVQTHVANILVKLEVSNRHEAVAFAVSRGLIDQA